MRNSERTYLIMLIKIRLDTKFSELADQFGLSLSYASKIFLKTIPILAKALKNFIVRFDGNDTKQSILLNLPIAFRYKYCNVSCNVDCLAREIQKPSKPLHQALTGQNTKNAIL